MHVRRVCVLTVVVALTGLLSGAAGGAAPTASAAMAAVLDAIPQKYRTGGPAAVSDDVATAAAPGTGPAASRVVERPAVPAPVVPAPAVPAPVVEKPPVEKPAVETSEPDRPRTVPGTPCRRTARACIELSSNQAWLIRDGEVSYGPVPITHGRKGFRTPTGTFDVDFRNRDHVSSIYDAPMPYSVFFNGGIAFHQGSLNEKSHGCIHLSRSAAREFFDSLRRGDVVQVVR